MTNLGHSGRPAAWHFVLSGDHVVGMMSANQCRVDMLALEAERDRLREALERIAAMTPDEVIVQRIVREALRDA